MRKQEKEKTELTATQQKRLVLSSLSRRCKQLRDVRYREAKTDLERDYWTSRTVNQLLMIFLHNKNGNLEFKTFHEWKRENKTIKKGEKAVLIWGQPRKATAKSEQQQERPQTNNEQNSDEETYKLFPICYLFSNLQIV